MFRVFVCFVCFVTLFACLLVSLFACCLCFVCLFICLSVRLFVCLFVCLLVFLVCPQDDAEDTDAVEYTKEQRSLTSGWGREFLTRAAKAVPQLRRVLHACVLLELAYLLPESGRR